MTLIRRPASSVPLEHSMTKRLPRARIPVGAVFQEPMLARQPQRSVRTALLDRSKARRDRVSACFARKALTVLPHAQAARTPVVRALQEPLTLRMAWETALLAENVPQAATTTTLAQGKLTPAGPVLQAHGAQCWEQIPLLCVISAHQVPTARLKAL